MSTRQRIDWNSVRARLRDSQAAIEQDLTVVAGRRLEEVYHDRARQFAARSTAVAEHSNAWPALVFAVGNERCCIATTSVVEVLRCAKCSPVPGAPAQLLGVINVRGQICSVLDLARILELPAAAGRSPGYIVLVRQGGAEVGLRVDEIEQIEMVSSETCGNLDWAANGGGARLAAGKNGQRATILDVEEIIAGAGVKSLGNPIGFPRAASL
jgi:purine-binding chemotaxis protein CheW